MDRNENPRADRGLGTSVFSDGRDPTTTPQGKPQRDRARALLTALRAEYPVLAEYRPLAIGIRAAVYAASPGVTRKTINIALAMHCRCDNYLQSIAAGGPRYALDGASCGEVTEAHRAAAVLALTRRSEKPPRAPRHEASANLPLLRLARSERR